MALAVRFNFGGVSHNPTREELEQIGAKWVNLLRAEGVDTPQVPVGVAGSREAFNLAYEKAIPTAWRPAHTLTGEACEQSLQVSTNQIFLRT